ncbi:MAG: hypothetical protein F4Y38_12815 [Gemmatimonadetes bacterium]|nr:hypothetical protein [Gemmatimonadota bacterium]MXY50163.1 hypothetical protein [Gemmatimonadota bacterium]MYG84035.1 hypothetical protein [Gemmatimonadota bacterium]MYJ88398.1 hypothetical protein [Gemmatimonadota bacterium]
MARHQGTVLVDTNVILETYRTGSWRSLAGGYPVETVEDCVAETQAGFQRRGSAIRVIEGELRNSLKAVHAVENRERAALAIRITGITLDRGEASLWAHALSRTDAWVLCGPDRASLRCGVRLGFRQRLVSLEDLLDNVGNRSRTTLRPAYTRRWHKRVIGELLLMEKDEPI